MSDISHPQLFSWTSCTTQIHVKDYIYLCILIIAFVHTTLFNPSPCYADIVVEALVSSDPFSESGSRFQAVDLLFVPDSDTPSTPSESPSLYNCVLQVCVLSNTITLYVNEPYINGSA